MTAQTQTKTAQTQTNGQAFFQVFSTKNDRNGNPRRLILVYNAIAEVIRVIECDSSNPNIVKSEEFTKMFQMPTINVQPAEYNELKTAFHAKVEYLR